jgi:sugar lactone lactonase YvrE
VPYATGDIFGSANGAEFDAAGNLYVADPFAGLVKVRPGGRIDPDWKAELPGANGVATLGGQVFTTLVLDPLSSVVRVPAARPEQHQTFVELSPGGEGKIPDDLAVGPDFRLYVTTYGSGEIFRIDLAGRSCVLLSGLDRPTSVRFAEHFGRPGDMYVTQASGSVLRVRL